MDLFRVLFYVSKKSPHQIQPAEKERLEYDKKSLNCLQNY